MPVIIGMDSHKRSATIEVITELGDVVTVEKFGTDQSGYGEMLSFGRRFPERTWAVEGCNGVGRHVAHRLVHDGETVLDVPAKLSAQVRVFATGNGRKTEPVDSHSVALVALRTSNLVRVRADPELVVMGMLVDRRDELGRARTQAVNRLHRLLLELFAGGAKKFLPAAQACALVATIKPRDIVGKTRRRLAVDLITELEIIDKKIKVADKDLRELVMARGCTSLDGIGPSGAAWLLADVGDIHRFGNRDRFASWNGTAPLDASSGEQQRYRLSRAGNRRINRTLHIMGVVQLRNPTAGRVYFDSKKAAGKTSMEAMRALKRRLSNVVYARMLADQKRGEAAGPGGHSGTTLQSSVTGLPPDTGPSDKPNPNLPPASLPPPRPPLGIKGSLLVGKGTTFQLPYPAPASG
ncbi:IS110 family transposase [Amycolatopsis balhimycina]|uniref:IS110 family transposase n=1 Tax=Amycolatopsis balhimycina TaxID=208443 RepID=UPI0003658F23|nr:IS110 family transposase [Amycolatopsis balhimycina]